MLKLRNTKLLLILVVVCFATNHRSCGSVTPPSEHNLGQCSQAKLGLLNLNDFCVFPDDNILFWGKRCFLPEQEVNEFKKQNLAIDDCSGGHEKSYENIKCSAADLTPNTKTKFCVSGTSTFATNTEGDITCKVRRPNLLLLSKDLPDCSSLAEWNIGGPDKECSPGWLENLRQSAINPNLIFCSTDDEENVKVVDSQTSCVISKNEVPKSASVSSQCNELSNGRDTYPDEHSLDSIPDCPQQWRTNAFMKGKKVCKYGDRFYIFETSGEWICHLVNTQGGYIHVRCEPWVFTSIRIQEFNPVGLRDCDVKVLKHFQSGMAKGRVIMCRVSRGYLLFYPLSNTICRLPQQFWPKTKLFQYKPCNSSILALGAGKIDADNERTIDAGNLVDCEVSAEYVFYSRRDRVMQFCRLPDGAWGLYFVRTERVCKLSSDIKPLTKLDVYLPCNEPASPDVDVDVSKVVFCRDFKWSSTLILNPSNKFACSYGKELLIFVQNFSVVCRVKENEKPKVHQILLKLKFCGDNHLKLVIQIINQNTLAKKRKAICEVKVAGPRQKAAKLRRIVAPKVTNWVGSSLSHPFAIEDVRLGNVHRFPTEESVTNASAGVLSRSLLQINIKLQTQFTVVVLSQDVEATDFPADLARALRKNVHKFDETGTYTADPQSIKVREVSSEETKSGVEFVWKRGHTVLLSSSVMLAVVVLIAFLCFILRHGRPKDIFQRRARPRLQPRGPQGRVAWGRVLRGGLSAPPEAS